MLLLLSFTTIAFEEGQCFTQQQINDYDTNTLTAQDIKLQKTNRFFIWHNVLYAEYSYLDFQWNEEKQKYCTFLETDNVGIEIYILIDANNQGHSWTEIFTEVYKHFSQTARKRTLTILKDKIENYQTGVNEQSFYDWMGDWEI